MSAQFHPYPGFSGRLALIHLEFPAIVGSSPCSDTVGSAGDFSGTRRKRKPEVLFTSRSPVGGRPKKARSELLPAPQRWTRGLFAIARSENPG